MKRILSAALACAVLLAGCAAPASTSGAPGGTSAVSAPEPTPAPTPSLAPKEVSLEEWRAAMPANAPSFSHESIDLTLDEQVLWPEQVELLIWAWEGTLEEADAAFGLPAGSFSLWEDTYYPPPEGAIAIRAEGYVLPKVPMERVTVDVPWLMYDFGRPNQYDLPADLDEQALCALAAAHYFLYNFNGMHHGFDPCEFDQETYCSTATEGAFTPVTATWCSFLTVCSPRTITPGCWAAPSPPVRPPIPACSTRARETPSAFWQGTGAGTSPIAARYTASLPSSRTAVCCSGSFRSIWTKTTKTLSAGARATNTPPWRPAPPRCG